MDVTQLTDDELDALRRDLAMELERRDRIRGIPAMIADLSRKFVTDGGKETALDEALDKGIGRERKPDTPGGNDNGTTTEPPTPPVPPRQR